MKIPVLFGKNGLLYLIATIKIGRVISNIRFIIDTGSNRTYINWVDARRLSVPFNHLPKSPEGTVKIAGETLELRIADKGVIHVFDDKMVVKSFILFSPLIGRPTSRESETIVPSILGTDFLEKHGLTLHFNPKGESYFESE